MNFMVVDIDGYDVLLGHNFWIKIGIVVHVEWSLIQIQHGPRENVQMLRLNMVNLLQVLGNEARNWKDELQQNLPKFLENLEIIEKGSCLDLLKGKHVSNFYQPYDGLEYNYNEDDDDDDDQSKMVVRKIISILYC